MERIRVNIVEKRDDSYDIVIGENLFKDIVDGLKALNLSRIAIITDSNVKKLYANDFLSLLKKAGMKPILVSFPAGEKSKNRFTKEKIEDVLTENDFGRDSVVIALGGGVVGDLAGFVSSTYMRGIPYLQIPTTLLAMVDSSLGGKTAINTKKAKNIIGTFYQPKKVFIDITALKTISEEELLNGVAEMIKHAIISDNKYFIYLMDYMKEILALEKKHLITAIKWSCMIKKKIVEQDEKESHIRKKLNFGHTLAHAIEKTSNFSIPHGRAVLMGVFLETKISEEIGLLNQLDASKIYYLIEKTGCKLSLEKLDKKEIFENTKYDKKKTQSMVKYVLPIKIGEVDINIDVSSEIVLKALGGSK